MMSLKKKVYGGGGCGVAFTLFGIVTTGPVWATEALIENALSAGPPAIAETATVMDWEGKVLREGTGTYTCFPHMEEGTEAMCLDAEWQALGKALMNEDEDYRPSRLGLGYMLAGDAPGGGASNIDPFAKERTADNQWIIEGPHLMVIVPDPALLEGFNTDPSSGEPYVMWKDTPFAHIMVPTGPRPEQPE